MKPKDMIRIQGIYQRKLCAYYKGKKVKRGPYWFGWWMENGKQVEKYIGKELPKQLEFLFKERFKLPGRKYYSYPNHKTVNTQAT